MLSVQQSLVSRSAPGSPCMVGAVGARHKGAKKFSKHRWEAAVVFLCQEALAPCWRLRTAVCCLLCVFVMVQAPSPPPPLLTVFALPLLPCRPIKVGYGREALRTGCVGGLAGLVLPFTAAEGERHAFRQPCNVISCRWNAFHSGVVGMA